MNIKYKTLDLLSIAWVAMGVIIFLLGWCRIYYAVPLVLLMCWVIWKQYREGDEGELHISKTNFWVAFALCFLLMLLCGIGGYVVQSNDHFGRNAIFKTIFDYSWPVYDQATDNYMDYYLAFWMLPALIGKLFNSLELGYAMQLLWMSIGMVLMYLQICRNMGKARVSYIWFLYFFSGLKLIECILYFPLFGEGNSISNIINIVSTNGSPSCFHAGPVVQLLYDPFNQTIPLFLVMLIVLNNVRNKNLPFVYSLLLLYAPFPFIGFAPIMLYLFVKNLMALDGNRLRGLFSLSNITALLIILVVGFYYMANINGSHRGLRPVDNWVETLYGFLLYVVFDYAVYLAIGYKMSKDKVMLWIAIVSTAIFAWFMVGLHNDFCFRTNMPLTLIACLLVIKRFYNEKRNSAIRRVMIGCYIVAGIPAQIHPCMRYLSSIYIAAGHPQEELNNYQHFVDVNSLYVFQQKKMRNEDLPNVFDCGEWEWMCNSFRGTPDSFFFKYLSR